MNSDLKVGSAANIDRAHPPWKDLVGLPLMVSRAESPRRSAPKDAPGYSRAGCIGDILMAAWREKVVHVTVRPQLISTFGRADAGGLEADLGLGICSDPLYPGWRSVASIWDARSGANRRRSKPTPTPIGQGARVG